LIFAGSCFTGLWVEPKIEAIGNRADAVTRVLEDWVAAAKNALGADLNAVVLFGSAAEDRLRPSSDVNVVMVLRRFDAQAMSGLRESFRAAHAAIRLEVMFLLEREISEATEAFAVKFADILQRRRVLLGADPFRDITLSRGAEIARLRQQLLSCVLRLRHRYMLSSLREEQATRVIAESAGVVRACAEALRELSGGSVTSPKLALEAFVAEQADAELALLPARLSRARETGRLDVGQAAPTLLLVIQLVERLHAAAACLS